MLHAEKVTVESDEHGFELHVTDDEGELHVFNVHGCAEALYDSVKAAIGPWLAERDSARAEVAAGIAGELLERGPGELAFDYYERTGDDEPLREGADLLRKQAREAGA